MGDIFGLMRLPHRWIVVSTLILSILAARGAKSLSVMWMLLLSFEAMYFYSPTSYAVQITPPLAIDLYQGPVLELPLRTMNGDLRGRYLMWQREHKQPIAYALLMQGWSPELDTEPLLIAITAIDRSDPISIRTVEAEQFRKGGFAKSVQAWQAQPHWEDLQGASKRLSDLGFQQIVLHRTALHEQDAIEAQRILEASLGLPTIESDEVLLWSL